jgi:hypothetical protein
MLLVELQAANPAIRPNARTFLRLLPDTSTHLIYWLRHGIRLQQTFVKSGLLMARTSGLYQRANEKSMRIARFDVGGCGGGATGPHPT